MRVDPVRKSARSQLVSLQTESYRAIMQTMREAWTDERLDDLNKKVDDGFARVDRRFDRFEASVDKRFDKVDERFDKVDKRFEQVDARFETMIDRFDAMNRSLLGGMGLIIAALIGVIATQL